MTIRIRGELNPQNWFSRVNLRVQEEETEFTKAVKKIYQEYKPKIEESFAQTPGPSKGNFVWSNRTQEANDRGRRWWFWALKNNEVPTAGGQYVRRGGLADAFDLTLNFFEDEQAELIIAPKSDQYDDEGRFKYRWVVGTFGQRRGADWQIPGHKQTGWWLLNKKSRQVIEGFFEEVQEQIDINRTRIRTQ